MLRWSVIAKAVVHTATNWTINKPEGKMSRIDVTRQHKNKMDRRIHY